MPFTHTPYAGEADYRHMRGLLVQTYALGGPPVYCTVGDLDWWRWGPTGGSDNHIALTELWWDERGTLAGFAWPSTAWGNELQLDLLVYPHQPALVEMMLDWAEAQQRAASAAMPRSMTVWAYTRDQTRTKLFQARGYTPTGSAYAFLGQNLDADLPIQPLPPGYAIRHVQGEADFPARVEVHRIAFSPSRLTGDIYRALVAEAPTYRAELDLVVAAPDRSFASYCLV
jgi:mycothiol synthase